MTVEPDKVLEAEPMDVTEVVDQKLIRSLNLEIAKLRVDMTSNQESLDMAIAEQDFVKVYIILVTMYHRFHTFSSLICFNVTSIFTDTSSVFSCKVDACLVSIT